jgi:predicted site-specific integrase-resolvase
MNKKILKPREMAKLLNISVKTLQRWDNSGKLNAYRNPSNRRYYYYEQYLDYIGELPNNKGKIVIYTRVSTRNQKEDLENQKEFLKDFANGRGLIVDEVISDIGSGLNYNRKRWNTLLDEVTEGKISKIIIAHKDRFIRFGFEWFERFLNKQGVEILVVNNEKMSSQEEIVKDIVSILHVFSCKIYGLRKYKKEIKEDDDL